MICRCVAVVMWNQRHRRLKRCRRFGGLVTARLGLGATAPAYLVSDYAGKTARSLASVGPTTTEGGATPWMDRPLANACRDGSRGCRGAREWQAHAGPEIDQALDSLLRAIRCLPADDAQSCSAPGRAGRKRRTPSAGPRPNNLWAKPNRPTGNTICARRSPCVCGLPGPVPDDANVATVDTDVPRWHAVYMPRPSWSRSRPR